MRQFVSQVDAKDRFTFVDENWVAFAVENGRPDLTAENVTDTSLWDHVTDRNTRQFYRIFMTKVRQTGRPLQLPFRCDAPACRRFMEMNILGLGGGGLEFRSLLLREESRSQVALLDRGFPRSPGLIVMCAWCKKVRTSRWLEAEDAVRELKLFDRETLPRVSHSICPECSRVLTEKTEECEKD